MNWRLAFDIGMVVYLFVVFLWVQHTMIQLRQLKRKLDQLQWALDMSMEHIGSGTWPAPRK